MMIERGNLQRMRMRIRMRMEWNKFNENKNG